MIISTIIVFLFAALLMWSVVKGARHWNSLPEQQKRIHELAGMMSEEACQGNMMSAK